MLPHDIPLQNASNLRDLGGWKAADGRSVRRGKVFRAPALVDLSVADQAVIATLGLRTLCDFRGIGERRKRPVEIAGAQSCSVAIEPSVGGGLKDILRTGQVSGHFTPDDMMDLLRNAYTAYALQSIPQYRAMFGHILRDDGLPLLLHCSAGKDRTGFGSALLLTALGVAWEDVVADYLATNRFWRRETASEFSMPDDLKDVLLCAHEPLLALAFDAVRREYGSVEAYLAGPMGLDSTARSRLTELLLGD
jgi:protein-tyrosine phosphatase